MSYYKYYFTSAELPGSAGRIQAKNQLVYNLLSQNVPEGTPVLELGVGKGWFAQVCLDHSHPYQGVEANEKQCRALMANGLNMTCGQVPPVSVQSPEDGFGLVYSAHLLEHLPNSQAVHDLLVGCASLLGERGIVAMLFPDAMAMGKHFWNCDYTHTFPTTERRVAQAMADAGLEVIATHRLCGHYTGGMRLLARAGSQPLILKAAQMVARSPERKDLIYRGWMYLQQDILLVARLPGAS